MPPPKSAVAKGKQRLRDSPSTVEPVSAKKAGPTTRKTRNLRKNSVIPSSIPTENVIREESPRPLTRRGKGKGKGKGKAKATPRNSNVAKRRRISDEQVSDHYDRPSEESEDELLIPAGGDTKQEPDVNMDVDLPIAGPSGQKRKRVSAPTPSMTPRNTRSSMQVTTPGLRASASTTFSSAGTRVFAKWNMDKFYYSGTVVSAGMKLNSYNVLFDDAWNCAVMVHEMRTYSLRVGDYVCIKNTNYSGIVEDITIRTPKAMDTVTVRFDDDSTTEYTIRQIRVRMNTIAADWNDRKIDHEAIVTQDRFGTVPMPTLPAPKAYSAGRRSVSSSITGIFSSYGLLVTGVEKDSKIGIVAKIKSNGGAAVDNWDKLINLEGVLDDDDRLTFTKANAHWIGDPAIQKVYLVTSEAILTPKYLMAIALGVPCLSEKWIEEAVENVSNATTDPFVNWN